jgi:restriction system protein
MGLKMSEAGLVPPSGGFSKLRSFRCAQSVYDGHDQMVQAARSGVQNIAEGSLASATSKKTELDLTGVARAGLGELLLDFQDYLPQKKLRQWEKDDLEALAVRGVWTEDRSDEPDRSDGSDESDSFRYSELPAEAPSVVDRDTSLCYTSVGGV